jgi:hypothetical protein
VIDTIACVVLAAGSMSANDFSQAIDFDLDESPKRIIFWR